MLDGEPEDAIRAIDDFDVLPGEEAPELVEEEDEEEE